MNMAEKINANPTIYSVATVNRHDSVDAIDEDEVDEFDSMEVFGEMPAIAHTVQD
jgi:hypothetical protein